MVARNTWPHPQLEALATAMGQQQCYGLHPVIFAVVGQLANLSCEDTALAFLHGMTTGLCSAAIRLGVLGHLRAQQILKAVAPTITAVLDEAWRLSMENMWSCSPALEIAQMEHQQLQSRQFAN